MTTEGERILNWWRTNAFDDDGQFHGAIENDGTPVPGADRGIILATRILWTFSRAITSGFEPIETNAIVADRTYHFLREHFWDEEHLGFYWMLDGDNHPTNPRKHIYAQSFAIYALAEYYAATGEVDALKTAQLTYHMIERHAADGANGGYYESFTGSWEPDLDLLLGSGDLDAAKSMNTHLHLLEAYTRLYQVWPNSELQSRLRSLIQVVTERVLNPSTAHFVLFFTPDWMPKSDLVSYGHDIEGSWLLYEAAEALGDEQIVERVRSLALRMVRATLNEGIDADHGVLNEGRGAQIIDSDKHWWPQAEAVVGLVNAYQLSRDTQYLNHALQVWRFIEARMIDNKYGEWIWKVNRSGSPDLSKYKVEPWKGPYHNTRACMEVWKRLT